MSRWITYLWQALATRQPDVDRWDDASVRAAFRSIIEREWGAAGFQDDAPSHEDRPLGIDGSSGLSLFHQFWPWFCPW